MNPAVRTWIDELLPPAAPVVLCLLLALIAALPYRIPGLPAVMPQLMLIAVFYWSLTRPDLLPVLAVFLVGLFQDIITGGPLGLGALVLMLVRMLIVSQRRVLMDKPFVVGWSGFMVVALAAAVVSWILAATYYGHIPDPRPPLVQLVLTIAIYPALTWCLGRVRMTLYR